MDELKKLEDSIKYYATEYYNGNPQISDEQFDELVDKLKSLKADSSILTTGWGFEINKDKVKHKYSHIGSLDKTKTFEDIPDRFYNKKVYISPKLDGLSAVAYYKNGKLIKGITRGNGEFGKDITEKLKCIIGSEIQDKSFTGAVRGELIISEANWKLIQENYKNDNLIAPRNFAAGIINRKEIDNDIKYIDLVVYKIIGQENEPTTEFRENILQWLQANFNKAIPIYYYPLMNKESWEAFHEKTFEEFKAIGYGLDGLVLTNEFVVYNTQTKGYIYDEVAFKFKSETSTTIVKSINWELSRTQRLVPVCEVEPVELSGAIVQRATGNNAQWVRDMNLGAGAEVEITRSNEVIPAILSVLQEGDNTLPENCPVCGSKLVWEGVDLKCNNNNCPNVKASDLQQWCENVGETDGLQWTLMRQYLLDFHITSLEELYRPSMIKFVMDTLNNKELSKTEIKIKEFFEKLYIKPVPAVKALKGLNIMRLGNKTSELLSQHQDLVLDYYWYLDSFFKGNEKDFSIIYNKMIYLLKEATTASLLNNKEKFMNLQYLVETDRLEFNGAEIKKDIKYIAVTGALVTMKRKDFEDHIKKYGYELTSNLKKCECLVTNTPDSGSSKNKQAQQYGIPIKTEKEFLETLG